MRVAVHTAVERDLIDDTAFSAADTLLAEIEDAKVIAKETFFSFVTERTLQHMGPPMLNPRHDKRPVGQRLTFREVARTPSDLLAPRQPAAVGGGPWRTTAYALQALARRHLHLRDEVVWKAVMNVVPTQAEVSLAERSETADGAFQEAMALYEEGAKQYRNAMRELAR